MKFTQTAVNKLKAPSGKADHVEFDDSMPGFGIRFRAGGPGTYFIQFKIGAKHGRLSLGKVAKITLDDAKAAAKREFAKVADKVNPAVERAKAAAKQADTIALSIDAFVEHLRREGRAGTHIAAVERTLRRYLQPLHRFAVADIDRAIVASALTKIRTERGPIAADRSRAHASKFWSWMIGEGLTDRNPILGTNKSGADRPRERVLTDGELTAIWKALEEDDYGSICKLLILTGCRRDEIGSLSRSEVNLDRKQIELPPARTKAGIEHVVPLSPAAFAILKARKARDGSDYVFGRGGQGGFSGWSKAKAALDKKLPDLPHWTPHDFRRTLSTTMHDRLEVAPHIVEAVLGHVSGHRAGVSRVYNKAEYSDQKRHALEAYARHIEQLLRPKLAVVK